MGFRRNLGTIIIFFSVLGLIINIGTLGLAGFFATSPSAQMQFGVESENIFDALIGSPIGIVFNLFWLAVGFLLRRGS